MQIVLRVIFYLAHFKIPGAPLASSSATFTKLSRFGCKFGTHFGLRVEHPDMVECQHHLSKAYLRQMFSSFPAHSDYYSLATFVVGANAVALCLLLCYLMNLPSLQPEKGSLESCHRLA